MTNTRPPTLSKVKLSAQHAFPESRNKFLPQVQKKTKQERSKSPQLGNTKYHGICGTTHTALYVQAAMSCLAAAEITNIGSVTWTQLLQRTTQIQIKTNLCLSSNLGTQSDGKHNNKNGNEVAI